METLLKEPNVRGQGWSKAVVATPTSFRSLSTQKVVIKTQYRYFCRPVWNFFRKTPLVRREMRALLALMRAGVAVPLVLAYEESAENSSLTTTFVQNAQSLDVALLAPGANRQSIVRSVARVIGRLHKAHWTHGALYPDHLLVVNGTAEANTYLIDLEKAKKWGGVKHDLNRFARYRPLFSEDEQALFDTEYRKTVSR